MGLLADPQEILPHHDYVVGEERQTHVTTNIHLGRNHAQKWQTDDGEFLLWGDIQLTSGTKRPREKATILKQMKSKITRLHHEEQKRLFLNSADRGRIDDNSPSLYHLIRARKWQERTAQTIQDRNGVTHTTMADTKHNFKDYMQTKFDIIPVDGESLRRLMQNVTRTLPQDAAKVLDTPITTDELRCAVQKGKSNKARAEYGIIQHFFIKVWETIKYDLIEIVSQMYIDGICDNQKHGLILCVPKKLKSTRPEVFRHLTLLSAELI